jgi:hypothetical protein
MVGNSEQVVKNKESLPNVLKAVLGYKKKKPIYLKKHIGFDICNVI